MNDLTQLSDQELTALYQKNKAAPQNTAPDVAKLSNAELLSLFESTRGNQKPQVGPVEDAMKNAVPALVRGTTAVAATARDLSDLGEFGLRKMGLPQEAVDIYRQIANQVAPSTRGPSSREMQGAVEQVTGPLYKAQTPLGQYTGGVLELAPAAVAGPGNVLRNLLTMAVVPGVAGEGAVDLTNTRGTDLEPWVRGGAQLTSATAAQFAARPRGPRAIANATEGVNVNQFQAAEQLFQEALQAGVPLSRPEALNHVTKGATRLTDIQRVVEGQGRMREFYAPRVDANDAAFARVADQVQPNPNPQPSTIGPQASQAAQGTINDVRGVINQASQPFYDASSTVRLTPQEMQQVRALPGFEEARNAVRNDPQLNRYVSNLPDDSVGFLNEVKKYFDNASTNAAGPMNAQRNQQRAAGYTQDATSVRSMAENASPDYQAALRIQEESRRRYLDPLLNGPLGKMAKDDLGTQQAISALFPTNPVPNSAGEISTAVSALARRNPRAAQDLVRAHMESVFNEATQRLQGGLNQYSGAGFAAVLRGNPQQAANLEAAVRALPNGDNVWPGVDRFLTFMEAQGQRQRIGSNTSFNTEFMNELKGSNSLIDATVQGAKTGLVKLPERLNNLMETWRLGQNTDQLARLFTDPRAGREFQRLAMLPSGGNQAVALMTRLAYMSQPSARAPQAGN